MTLGESIKVCFSKYADFSGAARRSEYWWWALFTFIAELALRIVSVRLEWAFVVATMLPSLAVGARRLHDTNRSGWLQLLWLVPVIGWVVLIVFSAQESRRPSVFVAE